MKRIFIIFVIPCLIMLFTHDALADRQGFIKTVVIDAGHGGKDPGAVGSKSREKDITLSIAKLLGQYINDNMPDVKVIYTREKDEFVTLYRRAQIANESHADLFISIHCNSTRGPAAIGTETFVMGLHKSQANLEVARKENAAILYEEDYMETYSGFDPNSPEASIIFSLYQNAYLKQSLSIASLIQDQFRERAMRTDRGVKQAGFLVLYQVTMPGILVEAGFLSNPREEQYLLSSEGQAHIASAIYRAFRDYKNQQDALAAARTHNGVDHANSDIQKDTRPIASQQASPSQSGPEASSPNDQVSQQKPAIQPLPETNKPPELHTPAGQQQNYPTKETTETKSLPVDFRVQIAVSNQMKPTNSPEFSGLEMVNCYVHQGLYKYTVGRLGSLEEAIALQANMKKKGFKDAFVVAFEDEQRITTAEALKRLNEAQSNQ